MKRLITLVVFLGLFFVPARASHIMGGEITWECLSNGQIKFTVKVYRDCTYPTVSTGGQVLRVFGYPGLTSIPLTFISPWNDISPQCYDPALSLTCSPGSGTIGLGSVAEYVFETEPMTLTGTPPATGWVFYWSDFARNSPVTNFLSASGGPIASSGFTVRAIMYPYTPQGSPTPSNTSPCYDSSPDFREKPSTVLCTGFPFTYNHNAFDSDLDSLSYSFGVPLGHTSSSTTWPAPPLQPAPGYSFGSPMPGPGQNPNNVPVTIDPNTGELSLTNYTPGNFISCIKVEAWRCGQLIAEVYRDLQVVYLGSCTLNNPPNTSVSSPNFTSPPGTTCLATVFAGDLVLFNLQASDFGLLNPNDPLSFQNVRIEASGGQFGTGYTSTATGCLQPPCATLTPPPPIANPLGSATTLSWQTTCDHLTSNGCGVSSKEYTFVFKVQDNACPVPASTSITFIVRVVPDSSGISLVSNGNTSFCTGDSVVLVAQAPVGASLQWMKDGISIIGATYAQFVAHISGNYSVQSFDTSGCALTSQSISVQVHPLPLAQINAPDTIAFCPNNTPELTCLVEAGSAYQWRLNGLAIPGAIDTIVSITQNGLYSVERIDSNGCSAISSEVFADVFAPISSISGQLVVSTNQAVTYSVVNTIGHNFTWSVTNGAIVAGQGTNAINVVWMAGQTGTLKVIESNAFCADSTSITVQSVLSSEDLIANRFVQLYPNPSHGLIQIQTIELGTKLTVYSMSGQAVFESHLWNHDNTIDLRFLAKRSYFVIFQHDERLQVEHISISQ